MDDTKIVDLYLQRNEAAIKETSDRYGNRLRSLAYGIVEDLQTAEECENDTYMETWNSIPPHEPRNYFYSFLARITRHISLNRCRDRSRLKRDAYICELSSEMEQCIPSPDDAECRVERAEFARALNGFLGSLEAEKRNVFLRSGFHICHLQTLWIFRKQNKIHVVPEQESAPGVPVEGGLRSMRGNEFLDNMELVDATYVEAADATPKKKTWIRWTAMAASLCLVVGALFGFGLLKYPGVEPDVEPDIEYYALHDLLNREDFASIIWGASGDNTSSDEDPNQSGSGDGDYFPEDGNWVEWNGIKISTGLQSALNQLKAEDLIAIGVESWADPSLIYDDYVELDDYVYNGKTYYEIRTEYAQVQEQHDALVTLKKFSHYYDEWDGKDVEEFWAKLYDIVPEDTVLKYFQGDKATGKFDTTAISNDLNATETDKLQLENDMAACRREYHTKFSAVPELSQMMNKGYYVVGNNRVFAVILPIGQLSQFAEDVKAVFAKEVIDTVMFRMATQNELGVGDPLDDEPAILPGGVVEEPVPDDVSIEDIPVDDEEKD